LRDLTHTGNVVRFANVDGLPQLSTLEAELESNAKRAWVSVRRSKNR
jgi:hypothetical protein